jgi:hypothetical protein
MRLRKQDGSQGVFHAKKNDFETRDIVVLSKGETGIIEYDNR